MDYNNPEALTGVSVINQSVILRADIKFFGLKNRLFPSMRHFF